MLALLYDVHGNLPALEAVLADADAAGGDRFLLGGDYALFGAWPVECVTRLSELDAEWIRGNGERWTAEPSQAPDNELVQGAVASCRDLLGEQTAGELGVVFGHTHLPFVRRTDAGIELVNPGSVGMPFDGDPRASYALVRDDGGIEHRRVAYDHRTSAAAVRDRFAAWGETVARRIERATYDV